MPFTCAPERDMYSESHSDNKDDVPIQSGNGDNAISRSIKEIANLKALKEYARLNIDKCQSGLLKYIDRLSEFGAPLEGDFYELDTPYYRPYGSANRQYSVGPSHQSLTKQPRTVAVSGRCVDLDFRHSHLSRLVDILHRAGILATYPTIQIFAENAEAWRTIWGKEPNKNTLRRGPWFA